MEMYFDNRLNQQFRKILIPIYKRKDTLKNVVVSSWFLYCNRDRYGY